MARKGLDFIEYEKLKDCLKKAEHILTQSNSPVMQCYYEYFENNSDFTADMYATLTSYTKLWQYNRVTPDISLYDILLYLYLLPWGDFIDDKIPSFENESEWHKWFMGRIARKKSYLSKLKYHEQSGDAMLGSINISRYIEQNRHILNIVQEQPKTNEELLRDFMKGVYVWSATAGERRFGSPLVTFPLFKEMSYKKQLGFFLLDLGAELYLSLSEMDIDEQPVPLIIPNDIISRQIISLTKSQVIPDVAYEQISGEVQLVSQKHHTIYDRVSLVNELEELESPQEKTDLVNTVVAKLQNESRSFSNITSRDTVGLSNVIQAFMKNDTALLSTTLGDITDVVLRGLPRFKGANSRHEKEDIKQAVSIIRKWSSYEFNFGADGKINILNYVKGDAAENTTLDMLFNSSLQSSTSPLRLEQDSQREELSLFDSMSVSDLRKVPIKLELTQFLVQAIEHERATLQFQRIYEMVSDSNSKVILAFIECKRKQHDKLNELTIFYKEFADSFVVEIRKARFRSIIEQALEQFINLGYMESYTYHDYISAYSLTFC